MKRTQYLSGLLVLSLPVLANSQSTPIINAVANPSFDADGTGVASPSGWQSSGSVDADYTEFGGHTGNFRLSHYSANAYSVDTTQTVRGLPDGWYTMRAWARRSTGNNNAYIALDCDHDHRAFEEDAVGARRTYVPVGWAS